ncbi:MAG: GNAT family N-acetyltransferase [Bacteroidota bacterium]|nr:GNAT family N-acetyltransferase [Bacteroidota bacterium]
MISIECYSGLPIEYESFLIERYNSFITTCRYIEVNYSSYEINYMLIYENDILIELILFGNKGNTSTCLNSLVDIDQDIVAEFTKEIFEKYSSIQKIDIVASYKEYLLPKAVSCPKSDDHILNLPQTIDDYYLELGYHTRKNIKNRKVRLSRDYPGVSFVTKYGDEIEENIVNKIIQLNCNRMKKKGIIPGIDYTYKNNIYKYSQYYGCVAYLEIDGVIAAGCIATILNKEIFLHVIAHDDSFSKYNVGEVCIFNLIQFSIEKGISTVHFLWGETELKKRFLAKPHLLFTYVLFRSYSLEYILRTVKTIFFSVLSKFGYSKLTQPFKNAIKFYRKKSWKV